MLEETAETELFESSIHLSAVGHSDIPVVGRVLSEPETRVSVSLAAHGDAGLSQKLVYANAEPNPTFEVTLAPNESFYKLQITSRQHTKLKLQLYYQHAYGNIQMVPDDLVHPLC